MVRAVAFRSGVFALTYFLLHGAVAATTAAEAEAKENAAAIAATCVKPTYPLASLRADESGDVRLAFLVDIDGSVIESKVTKSSGYPMLDGAALTAIQRCKFPNEVVDGKPGKRWVPVVYVWTIEGTKARPFPKASLTERAFLVKAKEADALTDPLARCLAFPDFPGNRWPAGLAQAACHLHFDPAISLAQVSGLIERGAMPELEALFRRDFARHFAKDDFSEIIHRDLGQFDASELAGRTSAAWLAKAPSSPFAHAARGAHLAALAWQARGAASATPMSKEQAARTTVLVQQAWAAYAKALDLEPRLIPALVGMEDLATLTNSPKDGDAAFARADAIDPACHALGKQHMLTRAPRLGGSFAAMDVYRQRLAPLAAARPLVALNLVLPAQEQGDDLAEALEHRKAAGVLAEAAQTAPYPDLFESLGLSRIASKGDPVDSLVVLLSAYRYADESVNAAQARAGLMVRNGETSWAVSSFRRAHALQPDNVETTFLLGMALFADFEFEQAEPLVAKGLSTPRFRREAELTLGNIALRLSQLDKASQLASAHVQAYPDATRGWYLLGYVKMAQSREAEAQAAFTTFLRQVDKKDRRFEYDVLVAQAYLNGDRSRVHAH
ncbi:MAG: TonB family protein [Massilia sp.]